MRAACSGYVIGRVSERAAAILLRLQNHPKMAFESSSQMERVVKVPEPLERWGHSISLSPSFHFPSFPSLLPFPLKGGPLNTARVWDSAGLSALHRAGKWLQKT